MPTVRDGGRGTSGAPIYDAFISYSHAADDLLAPRLQAALQRFAKPWWKRRALRIFRDETSLSASPQLWSSIAQALDASRWFVVLMSPTAAASPWVNQEIDYWLENKDPKRIIPVVTDGEFAWSESDIDPLSSAAPRSLYGAFTEEPRWVDLRFARTEEHLDLNNPQFSGAVADVAAAIHGISKDELASEEVRQHRRTVRTAGAAGAALLVLAFVAGAAALYAADQRDQVAVQRDQVASQRDEIASQRDEIASQRDEIADQRDLAEQNATQAIALADQLLDYVKQRSANDAPSSWDFASGGVVEAADPASFEYRSAVPADPRLDFLLEYCDTEGCFRDASFVHPTRLISTGAWNAYAPFHIRHGFLNADPPGERAPVGATVEVYIARRDGPDLGPEIFPLDRWHQFLPDYVVRESSLRCGPGYQTQAQAADCDMYVHDFPDGLPPGRYSIYVLWQAPCLQWVDASFCDRPYDVVSLFDSQVNTPFLAEDYTEDWGWPHELWSDATPRP